MVKITQVKQTTKLQGVKSFLANWNTIAETIWQMVRIGRERFKSYKKNGNSKQEKSWTITKGEVAGLLNYTRLNYT